jgi:hypothetical protein
VVGRVSSMRFVGRREELAALEATLAQAQAGTGALALVSGDAGMGKSRLISELLRGANEDGMTVLLGECLPLGAGELPYAPIVAALRSLVRERDAAEAEALFGPGRSELAGLRPERGPRTSPRDGCSKRSSRSSGRSRCRRRSCS